MPEGTVFTKARKIFANIAEQNNASGNSACKLREANISLWESTVPLEEYLSPLLTRKYSGIFRKKVDVKMNPIVQHIVRRFVIFKILKHLDSFIVRCVHFTILTLALRTEMANLRLLIIDMY